MDSYTVVWDTLVTFEVRLVSKCVMCLSTVFVFIFLRFLITLLSKPYY